jgi:hypothetical protein
MVTMDEQQRNLIKSWHAFHVQKLSCMCTNEISVMIVGVPAKIRTEHLERYQSGQLSQRRTNTFMPHASRYKEFSVRS